MTKEELINDKARELAKKYFPDEDNIWARGNIEAVKVKSACLEMASWLEKQEEKLDTHKVIEWLDEHVPTKFEDMQNYVNQFKKDFGL